MPKPLRIKPASQFTGLLALLFCASCSSNPGKTKPEKIDYLIQNAYNDHEFVGNALVVDNGQVIYQKSFGKANTETGKMNTDTTKFLLASLSKPFTAILILKLTEQGKVHLKDELGRYFRTIAGSKASKITVHQLLTHTSGIKELITEKQGFTEKELARSGFHFEPGSDFGYSNSGYVILKEIAEISTGRTYSDLIQELIFKPLQMTSSGVAGTLNDIPNLAIGYENATQQQPARINYSLKIVDGAGSLFTTASDMVRFDQGLYSDQFLPESLRKLMLHPHVKDKYGYGWYLRERGGIWDVSYHKGDLPGYTTFLSRKTTSRQMILLLANAGGLDLADLENEIARVLKTEE